MTHIPDAAVQDMLEQYSEGGCSGLADYERREVAMAMLQSALPYLYAPCAVEATTKEERHANTARNLIINQTSTDLDNIINGHDPERSILNNDVWDRLDKMACEIEALSKTVDVAAVREVPVSIDKLIAELKSAVDMCFSWSGSALLANELNATDTDEGHISLYKDLCGLGNSMSYLQSEIRALSLSEPVQGEQWQPIETAPKDGIEFIARCGADKPSFSCFWDGTAFMHFDHGEGLISYSPTEWMPLPTSPNTEVGKCN